jgi:hypothetical protein
MRGAIPPFPQYAFMKRCLIQQWMRLHGVVLKLSTGTLPLVSLSQTTFQKYSSTTIPDLCDRPDQPAHYYNHGLQLGFDVLTATWIGSEGTKSN